MSTTAHRAVTAGIDYADLYARWERGNWSATAIDFAQDRVDWHERMTDEQRRSAVWFYTLFFHGEDAVTDGLSPYIDAAPLEEQKYFLATQQVDEARHSVFFKRFMAEVAGLGDGTMAGGMLATESLLTWGHRKIFGKLDEMADRLRADRSLPQLCRAIALYHLIIEGALAQPGQHFMESYLERMDVLPGFREGIRHVSLDEQRHIAFGVKLLADAYATDPAMTTEAIRETLQDVGAHMAAIAMPPGWDETYYTTFGFTYDELAREGMRLLEMRLKTIGLDLERLDRFPIPFDVPFDERARRGRVLLEANLTGPDRPASRDRYATGVMFDALRRQADPRMVKPGTTIAWDFTDAEPWHISFDAGRATSGAGMTEHPDLRLRIGFDDWADMFAGRESPRRQLLTRRLRPRGDLRLFLRMRRIFA